MDSIRADKDSRILPQHDPKPDREIGPREKWFYAALVIVVAIVYYIIENYA